LMEKANYTGKGRPIVDTSGKIIETHCELLRRVPIFSGMAEDVLAELFCNATLQQFPRQTLLFEQNEPARRFFVIFSGWVRVFRHGRDGKDIVLHTQTKGDYCAHAALFDTGVYPANAIVLEDAELLVVPGEEFVKKIESNPKLARNVIAAMSARMRFLLDEIEQISSLSSTERLARFLVRMCEKGAASATVHLPLDKSLIASHLAMQPETLSRSLAKLREIGVEVRSSEVVIPDVDRLRSLVGSSVGA